MNDFPFHIPRKRQSPEISGTLRLRISSLGNIRFHVTTAPVRVCQFVWRMLTRLHGESFDALGSDCASLPAVLEVRSGRIETASFLSSRSESIFRAATKSSGHQNAVFSDG